MGAKKNKIIVDGGMLLIVGGIMSFFTDIIDAIASITPAAPNKCPVIDFVELIFKPYECSPNKALIAFVSAISPSGVDVP